MWLGLWQQRLVAIKIVNHGALDDSQADFDLKATSEAVLGCKVGCVCACVFWEKGNKCIAAGNRISL